MRLHTRKTGAHEKCRVMRFAARCYGVGIHLCPKHGPAIMRLHRVRPIEQAHIGRQIFAKICHPSRKPEVEHFLTDDAVGKPRCGGRVGEIHNACVKFAEIDGIRLVAVLPQRKEVGGACLLIQRPIYGQIRVYIAKEANAAFGQRRNLCGQIRIARSIPFPVPEQSLAKAGLTNADPIFAP